MAGQVMPVQTAQRKLRKISANGLRTTKKSIMSVEPTRRVTNATRFFERFPIISPMIQPTIKRGSSWAKRKSPLNSNGHDVGSSISGAIIQYVDSIIMSMVETKKKKKKNRDSKKSPGKVKKTCV